MSFEGGYWALNLHMAFVSAGVAQSKVHDNVFEIVERADKALYKAKNAGRNQVCAAPDE